MSSCPAPPALRVHVRHPTGHDYRTIAAIDAASSRHPWSAADVVHLRDLPRVWFLVAEPRGAVARGAGGERESIVGFAAFSMNSASIDILNFAVAPAYRQQGVGRQLMGCVCAKLARHRPVASVFVPDSQLVGHLFLRSMGFRAVGVDRAAYGDGGDAYRFERRLVVVEDAGVCVGIESRGKEGVRHD